MTLTTGPKISSCEIRISCPTGENRGADEIAATADALAAGRQQRAFPLTDIHIVENALHLFFGDHRAERCGTVGWIAHPESPWRAASTARPPRRRPSRARALANRPNTPAGVE